jgi:hypothetical protein
MAASLLHPAMAPAERGGVDALPDGSLLASYLAITPHGNLSVRSGSSPASRAPTSESRAASPDAQGAMRGQNSGSSYRPWRSRRIPPTRAPPRLRNLRIRALPDAATSSLGALADTSGNTPAPVAAETSLPPSGDRIHAPPTPPPLPLLPAASSWGLLVARDGTGSAGGGAATSSRLWRSCGRLGLLRRGHFPVRWRAGQRRRAGARRPGCGVPRRRRSRSR